MVAGRTDSARVLLTQCMRSAYTWDMNETVHRWDAMHYVATGEHRCVCGWTPKATRREAIAKRAIGTHATRANMNRDQS